MQEMLEAADVGGQAFCSLTLASLSSGTTFFFVCPLSFTQEEHFKS